MKVRLWPDFIGPKLGAVSGDKITLDGVEFDFSPLKEGQRLPLSATGSDHFVSTEYAVRVDGQINLVIRLKIDWNSPPELMDPPEPIVLSVKRGKIKFPDTSAPPAAAIEVAKND